jgi:hypothetical protein
MLMLGDDVLLQAERLDRIIELLDKLFPISSLEASPKKPSVELSSLHQLKRIQSFRE